MLTLFKRWYHRHFSQPGTVEFALVLLCSFLTVYYLMWLVGPLVVALCLAYCLDWPVEKLQKILKISRHAAAIAVMIVFCSVAVTTTVLIVPKMVKQGAEFYNTIVSFGLEATANPQKVVDVSDIGHDDLNSSTKSNLNNLQQGSGAVGSSHIADEKSNDDELNANFQSLADFGNPEYYNTSSSISDHTSRYDGLEPLKSDTLNPTASANISHDASNTLEPATSFSIPKNISENASIRIEENTLFHNATQNGHQVSLQPDTSLLLSNGNAGVTNESALSQKYTLDGTSAHTKYGITNVDDETKSGLAQSSTQGAITDKEINTPYNASKDANLESPNNNKQEKTSLNSSRSVYFEHLSPNITHAPQTVTGHINGSLTHGFVARVEQSLESREPTFTLSVADFDRNIANELHHLVLSLPEPLPSMLSLDTLEDSVRQTRIAGTNKIADLMRTQLAPSVVNAFTWLVYLIIVPIFTFLMLYNKPILQLRVARFILPSNQKVMKEFWPSLHHQISGYIRGKLIHVIIIAIANSLAFVVMGVNYALLLGVGVGLSVIIPYVGAVIIAVPVLIVSIFQFGFGTELWWVLIIYTFIQLLDSNVLTPMLFSKAMNLDAFSILAAILIFGGLWGFWGVFFAIPLATFIKTLITRWPSLDRNNPQHDYEFNFQRIAFQQIAFRRDLKDATIIEAETHDASDNQSKNINDKKDTSQDNSDLASDSAANDNAPEQDQKHAREKSTNAEPNDASETAVKENKHTDYNDSAQL